MLIWRLGTIEMLKNSEPVAFSEEMALQYLQEDFIQIFVDLHNGDASEKHGDVIYPMTILKLMQAIVHRRDEDEKDCY